MAKFEEWIDANYISKRNRCNTVLVYARRRAMNLLALYRACVRWGYEARKIARAEI